MLKEKLLKYISSSENKIPYLVFDEDKELLHEVQSLVADSLRIIYYEHNPLKIKLEVEKSKLEENILIYVPEKEPVSQDELKEFALLDLMVAGKVIRLDDVAGLTEDLGWRAQHKNLVAKFKDELKYNYVRELAERLDKDRMNEDSLIRVMLSAWLGATEIKTDEWILGKILCQPFNTADKHKVFINKVEKYNLKNNLKDIARGYFSKEPENFSNECISDLLCIMKYNCICLNIPGSKENDPYSDLKIREFSKAEKLNNFREYLFNDSDFSNSFPQILLSNSSQILESKIFQAYKLKHAYAYKTLELLWLILKEVSLSWETNSLKVLNELPEIRKEIEPQSVQGIAAGFIFYSASVNYKISGIKNFILNKPEEYLSAYTEEWYKVDQDYRMAINHFIKLSLEDSEEKIGIFEIHERLNKIYNNYLISLNKEWLACWSSTSFELDKKKVPLQADFFNREVEGRDVKVAVIISDGLRYEIGQELLSNLHQDSRNMAEMRWQFCSLPSVTMVGMANLLPAQVRKLSEDSVDVDGMATGSTPERENILRTKVNDAGAYLFSKVANLSQAEGRKVFTSPLVYVYHDRIDREGDKAKTEGNTFEAAEKTIQELSAFIKKLHSSYFVSRVIITADHGFLYSNDPLEEKDLEKVGMDETSEKHSRYIISKPSTNKILGYRIPLGKVSSFKEDKEVIIPEGVNRYRIPGSGTRYVHGGASLQELIVPVIESIRKKKEVSSKVNIMVPARELKVVSNVLRLKIFQEQPISAREKELRINVAIYKNKEVVSEQKEFTFDSVSANPSERMQEVILNLKPGMDATGMLNLLIYDIDDMLNPLNDIKVINSSAINADF